MAISQRVAKSWKKNIHILLFILPFVLSGLLAGFGVGFVQVVLASAARQKTYPTAPVQTPPPAHMPAPVSSTLASDTFQRQDQIFWGNAPNGQMWGADANQDTAFSIANGTGRIEGGQGALQAVLGPTVTDEEVVASGSVSHFDFAGAQVNFGVVLHWSDANNWDKAYIDGTHLVIITNRNGLTIQHKQVAFFANDHTFYKLRFRSAGALLSAKAWPADQPEPTNWMITLASPDAHPGQGGIRVLVQAATVIQVTSFIETTSGHS